MNQVTVVTRVSYESNNRGITQESISYKNNSTFRFFPTNIVKDRIISHHRHVQRVVL